MREELSENDIQRAVFTHLRTRGAPGILPFHPKNASADMAGRKRGIHVAQGVLPGIPDVIVIRKAMWSDCCEVYALELKRLSRRGKKPTEHEKNQHKTQYRMSLAGITTGIAYGLDEALMWLEEYGLLRGVTT